MQSDSISLEEITEARYPNEKYNVLIRCLKTDYKSVLRLLPMVCLFTYRSTQPDDFLNISVLKVFRKLTIKPLLSCQYVLSHRIFFRLSKKKCIEEHSCLSTFSYLSEFSFVR